MFSRYDEKLTRDMAYDLVKDKYHVTTKAEAKRIMKKIIPKEKDFQKSIKAEIKKAYPDAYGKKLTLMEYSEGGIPDLLVIIDGHYFGFEIKRPFIGGDATDLQKQNIQWIREAGGTAAVVSYPEQAMEIIGKYFGQQGGGK